jgi:hypothetical protein
MRHLAFVLIAACALTAAACGGDESANPGGDATTAESTTDDTTTEEVTTEETVTEVIDEACADQLGPLLTELSALDSRLSVGLNFERYSNLVSDIQVVYDQIPFEELGPECVNRVGIPTERAFNDYVKAYNIWNNCISDIDCDNDSITPRLQRQWSNATTRLGRAEQNLADLSGG